jgi:hypothetical protein
LRRARTRATNRNAICVVATIVAWEVGRRFKTVDVLGPQGVFSTVCNGVFFRWGFCVSLCTHFGTKGHAAHETAVVVTKSNRRMKSHEGTVVSANTSGKSCVTIASDSDTPMSVCVAPWWLNASRTLAGSVVASGNTLNNDVSMSGTVPHVVPGVMFVEPRRSPAQTLSFLVCSLGYLDILLIVLVTRPNCARTVWRGRDEG